MRRRTFVTIDQRQDIDAVLIWKQHIDLRLDTLESRLIILERAWKSISESTRPEWVFRENIEAIEEDNPRRMFLTKLEASFSDDDFRDILFDLHIDYDSLSAKNKQGKMRELFIRLERAGELYKLIDLAQKKRPNVTWPTL